MKINFTRIKNLSSSISENSNSIKGLSGVERVIQHTHKDFRSNFTEGCWLLSNYLDGSTKHILLLVQPVPIDGVISPYDDLDLKLGKHAHLSIMKYALGLETFICIPYIKTKEVDSSMTIKKIQSFCMKEHLPKSGKKLDLISRTNDFYSKIDYMCLNIHSQSSAPTSLKDLLLSKGFSEKAGGIRGFVKPNNPQEVGHLENESINNYFWTQHLRWRTKCFTSSPTADLDSLYLGNNGVYAVEIKSKRIATPENNFPSYFGIDIGTISKMLLFENKGTQKTKGLFIVEEVLEDDTYKYHATTMDNLYRNMSLVASGGGSSGFGGGGTQVLKVPIHAFKLFNKDFLNDL